MLKSNGGGEGTIVLICTKCDFRAPMQVETRGSNPANAIFIYFELGTSGGTTAMKLFWP